MPQEFEVVRCYSCETFQIHLTRKDKNFSCKICGLKQSRKKVYCKGNAKDCRIAVQQLNSNIQHEENKFLEEIIGLDEDVSNDTRQELVIEKGEVAKPTSSSKWNKFLDMTDDDSLIGSTGDGNIKHCDRFEVEDYKSDEQLVDQESSTCTVRAFTSVKRYHNCMPKQIVKKNHTSYNSDFKFSDESTSFKPILSENNNRHKDTDYDCNKYMKPKYEDLLHTTKVIGQNKNILESPTNTLEKIPAKEASPNSVLITDEEHENISLKKRPFENLSELDDNIFDIL